MKLLILAAGYATRLYPLTLHHAKPLLEVAGRPMIEHVLATTKGIRDLDHVFVVANEKFARDFEEWADAYRRTYPNGPPITVVNDHSTDDSNRLGATGDIKLVVDSQKVADDLLVVGSDNLFTEPLDRFVAFAQSHGPAVCVYDVGDLELMKKYSVAAVDAAGRLLEFEEKPTEPRTTLAAICVYCYPHATLPLVEQYLRDGNNPDQPGRFVAWLYRRQPVYAHQIHGPWMDIGSIEQLELARRMFAPQKRL
jgi:glucose-1-phosphate thymidylyltransferase